MFEDDLNYAQSMATLEVREVYNHEGISSKKVQRLCTVDSPQLESEGEFSSLMCVRWCDVEVVCSRARHEATEVTAVSCIL